MPGPQGREPDCLFCRIAGGDLGADRVLERPGTLAFRDLAPQAPTHVLVVPKVHHPTVAALGAADPALLAELVATADAVAGQEGLEGYRVVFNSGAEAGQSVFHVHAHVLGGRSLSWPPG